MFFYQTNNCLIQFARRHHVPGVPICRLETSQLKSCHQQCTNSRIIVFCSRPDPVSDAISGRFMRLVGPNNAVKFRDPRLNRSREIGLKAVRNGEQKYPVTKYSVWLQTLCRYGCPRKIWQFWVKQFSRYSSRSLCDGRWTTNERRRTQVVTLAKKE